MFNLEQAIADWRQQMLAAGIQTPVPLEELEIHLREEIERLKKSGLPEEKALEIAVSGVGQAKALNAEYEKLAGNYGLHLAVHNRLVFVIFLTLATAFLGLVGFFPPATMSSGMTYFTFASFQDTVGGSWFEFYFGVPLGITGANTIDVPMWCVELVLLVIVVGTAYLAFRSPRRRVLQTGS